MTSNGDTAQSTSAAFVAHLDSSRSLQPLRSSPDRALSPKSIRPASPPSRKPSSPSRGHPEQHADDVDDAQNESEAETVVLDGPAMDDDKDNKDGKVIKTEHTDDDSVSAMQALEKEPTARSPVANGRRKSSTDERDSSKVNGAKNGSGRDAKSPLPTSPVSKTTVKETSPANAKPSTQPATSPLQQPARGRSSSITESRKRKLREETRALEPPRQKVRTDGAGKERNPTSPATPGLPRAHRRSQSTQSLLQSGPGRRRKEVPPIAVPAHDRSDSSSESSSSWPSHHPDFAPHSRLKRSTHRAQTSPARAMPKKTTDKFGATRLARECEKGDLEEVKAAYEAAPEEIDQVDNAGIAPLQKAALRGFADVVEFLIDKGCKTNCQSLDNHDTPLIDAVENGHLDVVKLLLTKGKVNPHHQNTNGHRAIDVLDMEADDADAIAKELRLAMRREVDTTSNDDSNGAIQAQKPVSGLLYSERNIHELIRRCTIGDLPGIEELLNSNIRPNTACGVAAARGAHDDVLSILLASGLDQDPDPTDQDTPMMVAIGRGHGHLKIVRLLLQQDGFDPTRRDRRGKAYYEIAEERRGPNWEQERDLLKDAFDRYKPKLRSPKRTRKEAPQLSQVRAKTKSSSAREHSSSPRPEGRRGHLKTSSGTHVPPKRGRLISGREKANRRRRVVDDETSDDSDDDVRAPGSHRARSLSEEEVERPRKRNTKARSTDPDVGKRTKRLLSEGSEAEDRLRLKKAGKKAMHTKPNHDESHDDPKPRKVSAKSRRSEDPVKKRPLDDATGDEIKVRKSSSTPLVTVKPDRDATPDSVHEQRKQEAEAHAAEAKQKAEAEARKKEEEEARRREEELAKKRQEELAKRREEEEARKREEEAARIKEEEEAKRKADLEAKRIAEEEEERARLAAEAEAKRRAEEEASKQAARQDRLSKLPLALRLACERGNDRPLHFRGEQLGISAVFLPLYYAELMDIDPDCPADLGHDRWITSFQAVGILGLPEFDLTLCDAPYRDWPRKPVTVEQRKAFLRKCHPADFAQDLRFPDPGMAGYDSTAVEGQIKEARNQFMALDGLYWIPDTFLKQAVQADSYLSPLMTRISSDEQNPAMRIVINNESQMTITRFLEELSARSKEREKTSIQEKDEPAPQLPPG